MAGINPYLEQILTARYGEDVRGAIHDALEQTYADVDKPNVDTSLTVAGDAADAKETGDRITDVDDYVRDMDIRLIAAEENIADNTSTIGRVRTQVVGLNDYVSNLVDVTNSTSGKAAEAKVTGDTLEDHIQKINALQDWKDSLVDVTLSTSGKAAEAKATGDTLEEHAASIEALEAVDNELKNGHIAAVYSSFNPYINNITATKLSDGTYRLVTSDSTSLSSAYYSIAASHTLYSKKIRLTIKNNAEETLDLYDVLFTLREGAITSTDYSNIKQRLTGNIQSGEFAYLDFVPAETVNNDMSCYIYLLCPAGNSIDITVSLGILAEEDVVFVSNNRQNDIPSNSNTIVALANSNTENGKVEIDAEWDFGTVILSGGGNYIFEFRPYSIISKILQLTDYFGRFIHIDLPEGYEYKPIFFSGSTVDTYITNPNISPADYSTESDIFLKTPYIAVLVRRTNSAYMKDSDLTAVRIFADTLQKNDMKIFGNHCDETAALNNFSGQSATGWLLPINDRKLSDWIEIPKSNPYGSYMYDNYKYTVIASENNGEWGYFFSHCIFYNDKKELLSAITSNSQPVLTNKSAKYIKVIFNADSTKLYVGFNADGALPAWEPYRPIVPSDKITSLTDTIHNSDGAVTSLLRTCLEYAYNDEFGYGNHYTAYNEDCSRVESDGVEGGTSSPVYDGEKYQIDCSAFVHLALQNILPENSRYYSDRNNPAESGHVFNDKIVYDNAYERITANKLAKYAYDNGWLYTINKDMSNVEVGDLLFLCNQGEQYNFFENIGHTMIVAMKWKNTAANNYRVRIFEAATRSTPVIMSTVTKDEAGMVYGARIPLRYCSLDTHSILNGFEAIEQSIDLAANEYVTFSLPIDHSIAKGDIFTVCLKTSIPNNTHFELRTGSNNIGLTGSGVWYGNSGEQTLYGYVHHDHNSSVGATNISLRLVADSDVTGTVRIDAAKVIFGYYSPKVKEF